MRPCPACGVKEIKPNKLVCFPCWSLLSDPLRDRLYAAWNGGEVTDDYPAARTACLAEIDRRTLARSVARAARMRQ